MPVKKKSKELLHPHQTMPVSLILASVLLVVFAYLDLGSYTTSIWLKTFPAPWNDNIIYLIIIFAAILASGAGFLLTRQFERDDRARRIWMFFTIGWGIWTLSEIGFFIYIQFSQDLPDLSFMDLFWTLGYISFALSLFLQYQQIYARRKKVALLAFLASVLFVLLAILGITAWVRQAGFGVGGIWLTDYLYVFYPACDLVEGLAALWLSYLFGRGIWGRPWWGLFAFAVSDGISSWYWMGGYKVLSPSADTWLSLFTDVIYLGGYLIVALTCLSNFLLLKYGLASPRGETPKNQKSR